MVNARFVNLSAMARNVFKEIAKVFRNFFEADDIFGALKPTTGLMQLLGFPYHLEKKKDSEGYVSKMTPFFALNTSMGMLFFVWSTYKLYSMERDSIADTVIKESLVKYGDRTIVYSNCFVIGILYVSAWQDIRGFPKYAAILSDIESRLKTLGISKQYSQIKVTLIISSVLQSWIPCTQMVFSITVMYSWRDQPSFLELSPMFTPGYMYTLMLASHCIFIIQGGSVNCWIISSELELIHNKRFLDKAGVKWIYLNADATKLRQNLLLKELESSSRDEVVSERLTQYLKLYDRICDCTDTVNEIFSFRVVLIFGISFGTMIYNLFITLSSVGWMAKGGERALLFLSYALGQSMMHFINIFLTVFYLQGCQNSVSLVSTSICFLGLCHVMV